MKTSAPCLVVVPQDPSIREQRWRPRHRLEFEVTLVHAAAGSLQGRSANIGFGGMFVRTSMNGLRSNDIVSAYITIGSQRYHVPALVRWVTPEGIGLMFAHFDRNTLQVLGPLLTSMQLSLDEPDEWPEKRSAQA